MSLMPGWYQTSKPLQFRAIEEFATNTVEDSGFGITRSVFERGVRHAQSALCKSRASLQSEATSVYEQAQPIVRGFGDNPIVFSADLPIFLRPLNRGRRSRIPRII